MITSADLADVSLSSSQGTPTRAPGRGLRDWDTVEYDTPLPEVRVVMEQMEGNFVMPEVDDDLDEECPPDLFEDSESEAEESESEAEDENTAAYETAEEARVSENDTVTLRKSCRNRRQPRHLTECYLAKQPSKKESAPRNNEFELPFGVNTRNTAPVDCGKVMSTQCLSGRRKDCPVRSTCFLRHVDEVVGEPVKKYVKTQWKKTPEDCVNTISGSSSTNSKKNSAKSPNNHKCPHCPKSFPTKLGTKIHISKMHGSHLYHENADVGEMIAGADGTEGDKVQTEGGVESSKFANASWGELKGKKLDDAVSSAFLEVARWRRNLFKLPTGKAGQEFIEELTKILNHFADGTVFEPIALTLATIMFPLLLQKPSASSKTKDHVRYLEKRLILWKQGKLSDLLTECRAIQGKFSQKKNTRAVKAEQRFISQMERGKVSAAMRCIGTHQTGVLNVDAGVLQDLKSKHPAPMEKQDGGVIHGPLPRKAAEEVIYEDLDANAIFKAAKKLNGAGGVSGADADMWKRLLCSNQFKKKPAELCNVVARIGRKLNTEHVKSNYLRAFVAGRLIPLDKKPGVRPIGIGDVLRRIISSATISLLRPELVSSTAPLQTCAGLAGGIEASIHALRKMYEDPKTEAILLVDASNAFNAMNRAAALHNVQYTCPELATFVKNLYSCEAELFVTNSDETILSKEGTTQGGPESMPFYAAGTILLAIKREDEDLKKIFYADDGSGASTLDSLSVWWNNLQKEGPLFGYFPNASKTWLIVKPELVERAVTLFPDINHYGNITTEGHVYLGSFIGTEAATRIFVKDKVEEWKEDIKALVQIAKSEPQLAYSAYVYSVSRRWQFVCRTTPHISQHLQDLELEIRQNLLPAILGGRNINDEQRTMFSLPARLGGLGIQIPTEDADFEYGNSLLMTEQLTEAIYLQKSRLELDEDGLKKVRSEVRTRKSERYVHLKEHLKDRVSESEFKMMELASERGASVWLTTLPIKEFGFRLNKQQFVDALSMRYNLPLQNVPRVCVCGDEYSISHCLTCKNGGFVHLRHNAVRDTAHEIMKGICKDVRSEPPLLPVTGEQLAEGSNCKDGARADVSAIGLWIPLNRAFLDIRVFNPLAQTNWSMTIDEMYKSHEAQKKREYADRILQVEKGTFTPVVFSCTGGAGPEASRLIKQLALKLSLKKSERYSETVSYLRRRFCFDILRSCVISLRGERSPSKNVEVEAIYDLDIELYPKMEV